jgi:hypothetical protein
MKVPIFVLLIALTVLSPSCKETIADPVAQRYSSSITFLYYKDFDYGTDFMEEILELELVMHQDCKGNEENKYGYFHKAMFSLK